MSGLSMIRNPSFMRELTAQLVKARRVALTVGGHEIADVLKKYPPSGPGNKAGRISAKHKPMGFYERNRGYWSPRMNTGRGSFGTLSSFNKPGKSSGHFYTKNQGAMPYYAVVKGYKLTSHSEQLGKKWTIKLGTDSVTINNNVSYARFVQQAGKQSKVMAAIGWTTDKQAVDIVFKRGTFQKAFFRAYSVR